MNALYPLGFIVCCCLLVRIYREINKEMAPRPAAFQSHPTLHTPYNVQADQQPTGQRQAPSISRTAPVFFTSLAKETRI